MNLKQRISLLFASLLPALALAAYLLILPSGARASSCPPGDVYDPCPGHPYSCAGTPTGCVGINTGSFFFFCPPEHGSGPGPGTCEAGQCVHCLY